MFVSRSEPFTSPQVKALVCALAPAEANPAEIFPYVGQPTVHTVRGEKIVFPTVQSPSRKGTEEPKLFVAIITLAG